MRRRLQLVEHPAGDRHYLVMLISNVLRKNSAYDHQTLATQIQTIIGKANAMKNTSAKAADTGSVSR